MEMSHHVDALAQDLGAAAAVGDDSVVEAARRLTQALEPSLRLRLLDVLGEAALELTTQLPGGRVEVRLAGADAELVYTAETPSNHVGPAAAEDAASARVTLRLPESLKARVEAAAAREDLSVNAWLVRAVGRSLDRRQFGNRLTGFAQG